MGFGTVAANMLFFIAVLTISAGVVLYMNNYATETTARMTEQKNRIVDEIGTSIVITQATFDTNTNITTIYARNNGRTLIKESQVDVYLARERIPNTDFTLNVELDTHITNPEIWDPGETIKIIIPDKNLSSGTHTVKVLSINGVGDEMIISN